MFFERGGRAPHILMKVEAFVGKYRDHPLGNPREVDALQLKEHLKGRIIQGREDRLKAKHKHRVRLI